MMYLLFNVRAAPSGGALWPAVLEAMAAYQRRCQRPPTMAITHARDLDQVQLALPAARLRTAGEPIPLPGDIFMALEA